MTKTTTKMIRRIKKMRIRGRLTKSARKRRKREDRRKLKTRRGLTKSVRKRRIRKDRKKLKIKRGLIRSVRKRKKGLEKLPMIRNITLSSALLLEVSSQLVMFLKTNLGLMLLISKVNGWAGTGSPTSAHLFI